jgi:mannosyl-oligosaccharide glucosidase
MLGKGGLRSLSKGDQFYLFGSNYWRGAVWINVNYLTLRGLYKHYLNVGDLTLDSNDDSIGSPTMIKQSKQLYEAIRLRLIQSVYQNWKHNHVFWE